MGPGLGRAWACTLLLLCQWPSYADSKCCEKKVVPGLSSKAGTYNLVSNSDPVPGFCLGGCVYTKEDDSLPGTNYCFKEGDMNYTCSGGGCGENVEGWIEKYFQKECSMQINSVLNLNFRKQYSSQQQCGGWSSNYISNVSVEVYDNPSCEGAPVQEGMSGSTGFYSEALFLIKVNDTKPWSVFVSKEGFKSECQAIGMMVPFTNNYEYIYMVEDISETELIPTVSFNFTFDINNELLTDVFVQGNPMSCVNYTFPFRSSARKNKTKNKKFKQKSLHYHYNYDYDYSYDYDYNYDYDYGSGSEGGGGGANNSKCSPTCRYASWNTDPSIMACDCKGVIGGGLKFSDITLPNQQTPAGGANMSGSLFWYNEASSQVPLQIFTAFTEFSRRNNTSVRVCDSNLSISLQSKISPRNVQKNVPCFPPQIPPTTPMPTYPTYPTVPFPGGSGFPGLPTHSQGISDGLTLSPPTTPDSPGSGSGFPGTWPTSYPQWLTATPDEDQFSEVDGVLIWGKGDRFWIVGCMALDNIDQFLPLEVDFFTAKDPKDTPEFCGCLLSTMQMGQTEATKEAVKECYVVALNGGASPNNIGRKKKMTKKRGKKLQKYHEKKWKNKDKKLHKRLKKLERLNRQHKTAKSMKKLKKFVHKMKAKQPKSMTGRSKRDVTDEEFYKDDLEEEEFDENMFHEEEVAEDEISMDFGNRFDVGEYGDTYDESEDYIEHDYDYEDDSLSSDW